MKRGICADLWLAEPWKGGEPWYYNIRAAWPLTIIVILWNPWHHNHRHHERFAKPIWLPPPPRWCCSCWLVPSDWRIVVVDWRWCACLNPFPCNLGQNKLKRKFFYTYLWWFFPALSSTIFPLTSDSVFPCHWTVGRMSHSMTTLMTSTISTVTASSSFEHLRRFKRNAEEAMQHNSHPLAWIFLSLSFAWWMSI